MADLSFLSTAGSILQGYQQQQEWRQKMQMGQLELAQKQLEMQHMQQQAAMDAQFSKLDAMTSFAKGQQDQPQPDPAMAPYQATPMGGGQGAPGGGGPIPGAQPMQGGPQMGGGQPQGIGGNPLLDPRMMGATIGGQGRPQGGPPPGGMPQQPPQQAQGPQSAVDQLAAMQPPTQQSVAQAIFQQKVKAGADPNDPMLMRYVQQVAPKAFQSALESYKAQTSQLEARARIEESIANHRDTEADRAESRAMRQQEHADAEGDKALMRGLMAAKNGPLPEGEDTDRIVDAIGKYKLAPPNISSSRNPKNLQLMSKVYEKYPDYDTTKFGAKQATEKDFAAGPDSRTLRSNGVALSHLALGEQLVKALGNGDVRVLNSIRQRWQTETGNPAPTNFNAAKTIIADEVAKAVVGSTGAQADRDAVAAPLLAANSPEQLLGAMQTYKGLMAGQKAGLEAQFKRGTGADLDAGGGGGASPAPAKSIDGWGDVQVH